MNAPRKNSEPRESSAQQVDWSDFRDHIATADSEGRRKWIYPRKVNGRWFRWRTGFSYLLLAIMFAGPFVRIHGNPLLLMNIIDRKFVILGHIFWPQDMILFAISMLVIVVSVIVFTAAFGRLWCGWACPQTVMMEMVFRKIEYFIEGDAHEQRALNAAPWTAKKISKKIFKHAVFCALSFLVGNVLLSYIIGTEALFQIITDNPSSHIQGLTFMILFSLLFYGIFARFREQACTFVCPYGRLQSALLDENSIVVAYDHKRGEKRAPLKQGQPSALRKQTGLGDCVSCRQCVSVCPTGIDIRDGTQMECINCTACIDACDAVMDKIERPRGLIRYASLNGIERGERLRFTPRLAGYTVVLFVLASVLAFMIFTRADIEATFLRAPGSMFQQTPDGHFSNLYSVKVFNKTSREMPVELKLENIEGNLRVVGSSLDLPPQKLAESAVVVELAPAQMRSGSTPVIIGVYTGGKRVQTIKTSFVGPRN